MLFDTVASAIIVTNNGEEQGLAARANVHPTRNGIINLLPFLLLGIFFIIVGKFSCSNPTRFKPSINIIDANSSNTTGDAIDVNARPVKAQITPIMLNTNDNPTENDIICTNNFLFSTFEYPPTYPIINGNIPRLQGDNDAIIPAIRLARIDKGTKNKLV